MDKLKLKWFERTGPYRLQPEGSVRFYIVGPEGSRLPRTFERQEGEGICYWMNEAYAFGARRPSDSEAVKALREALEESRDFIDDLGDLPLERMTVERVDGVWNKVNAALNAVLSSAPQEKPSKKSPRRQWLDKMVGPDACEHCGGQARISKAAIKLPETYKDCPMCGGNGRTQTASEAFNWMIEKLGIEGWQRFCFQYNSRFLALSTLGLNAPSSSIPSEKPCAHQFNRKKVGWPCVKCGVEFEPVEPPAKDEGARSCRIDEFGGCSAHPDCPPASPRQDDRAKSLVPCCLCPDKHYPECPRAATPPEKP